MKSLLKLIALSMVISNMAIAAVPSSEEESSSSATALPIQQETLKQSDVKPKKSILSNVILGLDSENVKTVTSDANTYDGDIEAYQYLKTGYRLNDTTSVMMVNTWTQRYGYKENHAGTTYEDLQLRLTKSNLFHTGSIKWSSQARAYLPTSKSSSAIDQHVQLRGYLIGDMELTKRLSMSLFINPRYFVQTNKTAIVDGKARNTADWRLYNSVGLNYAITDDLAVETTVGMYQVKAHNQEMAYYQDYSTSMYYTVSKNFKLNGGIRANIGRVNIAKEGVELYDHNDSEYFLIAMMSI